MKYRANRLSIRTVVIRALSFSAAAAMALNPALAPAAAAESSITAPVAASAQTKVRFLARAAR